MRHTHCRTWNMAKKFKNAENEKCTMQDLEYGEKTENVENEKCALYALEYWEKAEKRGK